METEGPDVDEHGPMPGEQHVVGTGVAEDRALVQEGAGQAQREERGILQHAEAPLVGVAHGAHGP